MCIHPFSASSIVGQVQRGFAALQGEAPDLIDQMGIPFDPKEKKSDVGEEVVEEEEEVNEEGKEGEEGESAKKKDPLRKKRDPKEEMPLFLNQVTNLIAAAVPGPQLHHFRLLFNTGAGKLKQF